MTRRAAVALSVALFAALIAVYAVRPMATPTGSRWSLHTA
jgi:hypothetical protein